MGPGLLCPLCGLLLRAAVSVSCCRTALCRRCAVRSLIRSRRCGAASCRLRGDLDSVRLAPLQEMRRLCQERKLTSEAKAEPTEPSAHSFIKKESTPSALLQPRVPVKTEPRPQANEPGPPPPLQPILPSKEREVDDMEISFTDDEDDSLLSAVNVIRIQSFIEAVEDTEDPRSKSRGFQFDSYQSFQSPTVRLGRV